MHWARGLEQPLIVSPVGGALGGSSHGRWQSSTLAVSRHHVVGRRALK